MPAIIAIPEVTAHKEPTLAAQPQTRADNAGFWPTLLQYVRRQSVRRLQRTASSSHVSLHSIESPVERLAREHPALYLQIFAGL